jgi:hypothetical protein
VTFHESEITDDEAKMREFMFLIEDERPVLQPALITKTTGPLSAQEIEVFFEQLGESTAAAEKECMLREMARSAAVAGDPETLDPSTLELLEPMPPATWRALDATGRRLILAQLLTSEALFDCVSQETRGDHQPALKARKGT